MKSLFRVGHKKACKASQKERAAAVATPSFADHASDFITSTASAACAHCLASPAPLLCPGCHREQLLSYLQIDQQLSRTTKGRITKSRASWPRKNAPRPRRPRPWRSCSCGRRRCAMLGALQNSVSQLANVHGRPPGVALQHELPTRSMVLIVMVMLEGSLFSLHHYPFHPPSHGHPPGGRATGLCVGRLRRARQKLSPLVGN